MRFENLKTKDFCDQAEITRGKFHVKSKKYSRNRSCSTAKDTYSNMLRIPVTKTGSQKTKTVLEIYTNKTTSNNLLTTKYDLKSNLRCETEQSFLKLDESQKRRTQFSTHSKKQSKFHTNSIKLFDLKGDTSHDRNNQPISTQISRFNYTTHQLKLQSF